jgi:hypothetical protein
MNTLAKQVHNITPDSVQLLFADGSSVSIQMRSAEFFQEAFQAEGTDEQGVVYRLVTDGEDDPLVAGRQLESGEWEAVGPIAEVSRADS